MQEEWWYAERWQEEWWYAERWQKERWQEEWWYAERWQKERWQKEWWQHPPRRRCSRHGCSLGALQQLQER